MIGWFFLAVGAASLFVLPRREEWPAWVGTLLCGVGYALDSAPTIGVLLELVGLVFCVVACVQSIARVRRLRREIAALEAGK